MSLVTNGEHSDFMRNQDVAMRHISNCMPSIELSLRCKNIIDISKEFYELGKIDEEEHVQDLIKIAHLMGATYSIEKTE